MASELSAIRTRHLRKSYGDTVAVADLSLEVARGEVFGFVGPNGAGKTTAVKMLLGLVRPSGGEAYVLGRPVNEWELRTRVGFLPEHFRFPDWLTAREFLRLHGELYRMPEEVRERRIPELLELVGLAAHHARKLGSFSKGMLQRIGLAQALLNEPELVILDEPTSGLDPMGRRHVREIINDLRGRGTTVFLNSHFLSEVELTCDRVAFIRHGSIIQINDLDDLMDGEVRVEVRIGHVHEQILEGLSRWGQDLHVEGKRIIFRLQSEQDLPEIHRFLHQAGAEVFEVSPRRLSLEDLFIEIVGQDGGL